MSAKTIKSEVEGENNLCKYKILKRDTYSSNDYNPHDISKLIYPKTLLHKKWELYIAKRNEIFNDSSIFEIKVKRSSKRSTVRHTFKSLSWNKDKIENSNTGW